MGTATRHVVARDSVLEQEAQLHTGEEEMEQEAQLQCPSPLRRWRSGSRRLLGITVAQWPTWYWTKAVTIGKRPDLRPGKRQSRGPDQSSVLAAAARSGRVLARRRSCDRMFSLLGR